MKRPTHCPNCMRSCTAHTGTYCQECGEPLVQEPRRNVALIGGPESGPLGEDHEVGDAETPRSCRCDGTLHKKGTKSTCPRLVGFITWEGSE